MVFIHTLVLHGYVKVVLHSAFELLAENAVAFIDIGIGPCRNLLADRLVHTFNLFITLWRLYLYISGQMLLRRIDVGKYDVIGMNLNMNDYFECVAADTVELRRSLDRGQRGCRLLDFRDSPFLGK